MMKGNEKDCICANNGKHTKNCDAYRLSQFLLQAAAIALDQPDSPEEKKCCEECEFVYGGVTSPKMRECKYNGLDRNCSCHKPETTHVHKYDKYQGFNEWACECGDIELGAKPVSHEKDFIEEALQEYRKTFVRRKIGHFPFDSSLVFNDVETFLKEKLTEAHNAGYTEHAIDNKEDVNIAHERGRLAMKEEIEEFIDRPWLITDPTYNIQINIQRENWLRTLKSNILAAIREMK